MLVDDEIIVAAATRPHLYAILDGNPSFNISIRPVAALHAHSEAFKSLSEAEKQVFETELKTLQRVQALAPVPDAIPTLFTHDVTSALQISAIPEDSFARGFQAEFRDVSIAASVHRHATATRARNEQFLVLALHTVCVSSTAATPRSMSKIALPRSATQSLTWPRHGLTCKSSSGR